MSIELYFVRHGEVDAHWRGRLYGCLDIKLSDNGRQEAQRAAAFLASVPLAAVVSSGLSRTRYGAAHVARSRKFEEQHDARLREIDRGDWCGLTFEELAEQVPGGMDAWRADAWAMRPPNGENMTDVAERVGEVLDELAERYAGAAVCVVVHSHVIRAALARAMPAAKVLDLDLPTGAIVHVDWSANGPALLQWIHTFAADAPMPAADVLAGLPG